MRILFLATNLPIPVNSGAAIRSLSLLQALAAGGHELTFVSFTHAATPQSLEPLSSLCRSMTLVHRELVNLSQGSNYFARLAALATTKPYSVARFASAEMRTKLQEHLAASTFDVIFADGVFALVNLPDCAVPIALNCHNIEWVIVKRYAELENNPLKSLYAKLEFHNMRAFEHRAAQRSKMAMVCSDKDRSLLQALCADLKVCIVPNCVDTDTYFPAAEVNGVLSKPRILFQGGMDWYPNRDAVEFFSENMLPSIQRELPDVTFVVAGKNHPKEFLDKFNAIPGINFTGTVPDMRPYLAGAALVVVPLRIGSGTRLKILEAAASSKAVVSTTIGAEGLDFEHGKEIVIADQPEAFAREITALLHNPERLRRIGEAARRKVVARYSYTTLKIAVDQALSSLTRRVPPLESIPDVLR